tara:strand:- start:100 stop:747 length:648 start_codon:yes stop_codon:yes gene_type:complete
MYKHLLFFLLVGNLAKIILRFFPKLTKILTMNSNIKISVGLIIPLVAIIVFSVLIYTENNIAAIFAAIGGLLAWFLYSSVMDAKMPDVTGNIIILFGFLLSTAFFLNYGLTRNMFGGYGFDLEGAAISSILLFLIVLVGISFKQRYQDVDNKSFVSTPVPEPQRESPEEIVTNDGGLADDTLYDDNGEEDYDYDYDYDYEPYYDYEEDPEEYNGS